MLHRIRSSSFKSGCRFALEAPCNSVGVLFTSAFWTDGRNDRWCLPSYLHGHTQSTTTKQLSQMKPISPTDT